MEVLAVRSDADQPMRAEALLSSTQLNCRNHLLTPKAQRGDWAVLSLLGWPVAGCSGFAASRMG